MESAFLGVHDETPEWTGQDTDSLDFTGAFSKRRVGRVHGLAERSLSPFLPVIRQAGLISFFGLAVCPEECGEGPTLVLPRLCAQ